VTVLTWIALGVSAVSWLFTTRLVSVLAWKVARMELAVSELKRAAGVVSLPGLAVRLSAGERQANAARAEERREALRERRQQRMADLVRQRLSQAVTLTGTAPRDGEVQQ
jgi:hypothetical protein